MSDPAARLHMISKGSVIKEFLESVAIQIEALTAENARLKEALEHAVDARLTLAGEAAADMLAAAQDEHRREIAKVAAHARRDALNAFADRLGREADALDGGVSSKTIVARRIHSIEQLVWQCAAAMAREEAGVASGAGDLIAKGTVEGFDDETLREICLDSCAECGDPPCWQLPDKTSDCDGKVIRPCDECLAEWTRKRGQEGE